MVVIFMWNRSKGICFLRVLIFFDCFWMISYIINMIWMLICIYIVRFLNEKIVVLVIILVIIYLFGVIWEKDVFF